MRSVVILVAFLGLTASSCNRPETVKRKAVENGNRYLAEGKAEDATLQFRKAIQADAKFGDAYLGLGQAEWRRGNAEAAFAALSQAVALMPDEDKPKSELADICLNLYLRDPRRPAALYEKASDLAAKLSAKNANSFAALRAKGYLAMADGRPSKAIAFFESANQATPDQADIVSALVENLLLDNQGPKAEAIAKTYLAKHPAFGPLYTVLYTYYLGAKRQAEAQSILEDKVRNNPKQSSYRIELAKHFAMAGTQKEVAAALGQITGNPKDFPNGRLETGDFYTEMRRWPEARSEYETGLAAAVKDKPVYQKRLVRVMLAQADQQAAGKLLDEILKQTPGDADAKSSRAALRVASGTPENLEFALADYASLVKDHAENWEYRVQFAAALRRKGDLNGARAQYLTVAQKRPSEVSALQGLAEISIRTQQFADALRYADLTLELAPRNFSALLVRSAALASTGKRSEARGVLTNLVKAAPELREAQLQLAQLNVEENRFPEAEALFKRSYQPADGDLRALRGLVGAYSAQKQVDKAIALLQTELKQSSGSSAIRTLLAETAAQTGRYSLAQEQYRILSREQPKSAEIAIQLALVAQASGDRAGAIAELERARILQPGNPTVHALLGKVLDEAGRRDEAIQSYRQSITLKSNDPWVMNNLAYALAESGKDLEDAMRLAQGAVRAAPGEPNYADTLGWVFLKRRDHASALRVFQGLTEKQPANPTFRLHLAMALIDGGQTASAQKELRAALELKPDREELLLIQKLLR